MKLSTNLMQFCLGISIFLISFSMAHGQTVNEKYQTGSIYLQGRYYVKDGVKYPITSWKNLKKEMEVSPDAVMEYEKFQHKRSTAFIFETIGLLSVISSFYVDNEGLQYGLFFGGLGLTIVSFPINHKANNSLHKAIWLRNGAILN